MLFAQFRDPQFEEMLDLFAMLKKGHCDGIKVRIGRLQNLLSSSCMGMSICLKHMFYVWWLYYIVILKNIWIL